MVNLEPLAAIHAENTIDCIRREGRVSEKDVERIATHALHVLGEQGLYAMGLFLNTRKRDKDRQPANIIHEQTGHLLNEAGLLSAADQGRRTDLGKFYLGLTEVREGESTAVALQRLLLMRDLIETLLIYTRYAAKAADVGRR